MTVFSEHFTLNDDVSTSQNQSTMNQCRVSPQLSSSRNRHQRWRTVSWLLKMSQFSGRHRRTNSETEMCEFNDNSCIESPPYFFHRTSQTTNRHHDQSEFILLLLLLTQVLSSVENHHIVSSHCYNSLHRIYRIDYRMIIYCQSKDI